MTLAPHSARPRVGGDVGTFFDGQAAGYDAGHDEVTPGAHTLAVRMAAAVRLLGDGPGDVLDVGMGPGRLCEQLAARGWTVSGIDPSAAMVERARARLPAAGDRLRRGVAEAIPFDDDSFEAVTGTGVIEYVHDRPAAFTEIVRVLRPGGRLVLSVPNADALYTRMWAGGVRLATALRLQRGPARAYGAPGLTRAEFERLLADAGLRIEEVQPVSFLVVPPRIDRRLPVTSVRVARGVERMFPGLGPRLGAQVVLRARHM